MLCCCWGITDCNAPSSLAAPLVSPPLGNWEWRRLHSCGVQLPVTALGALAPHAVRFPLTLDCLEFMLYYTFVSSRSQGLVSSPSGPPKLRREGPQCSVSDTVCPRRSSLRHLWIRQALYNCRAKDYVCLHLRSTWWPPPPCSKLIRSFTPFLHHELHSGCTALLISIGNNCTADGFPHPTPPGPPFPLPWLRPSI